MLFGSFVRADHCQDFCNTQLGAEACSNGTSCTGGSKCHSLYWTSPARTSVCYSRGVPDDGCSNDLPVICSLQPRIPLHRTSTSACPHVNATFIGHPGQSPNTTFSLFFHTTSNVSRLTLHNDSSSTEGYEDRLPASERKEKPSTIQYGCTGCKHGVHVIRKVRERILLLSGDNQQLGSAIAAGGQHAVSHPIRLRLTAPSSEVYLQMGVYGANRLSELVQSVGIFTFIPALSTSSEESTNAAGSPVGSLLIGERHEAVLDALCDPTESGASVAAVHWIPLAVGQSTRQWVVGSSLSIEGQDVHDEGVSEYWAIDTGAERSTVPLKIYNATVAAIIAAGSTTGEYTPWRYLEIYNCTDENFERFPTLLFSLGGYGGGEGFTVRIEPGHYIPYRYKDTCFMHLMTGSVNQRDHVEKPPMWLVGMDIISRMVATFDHEGNRVGFCSANSRPRGQPSRILFR